MKHRFPHSWQFPTAYELYVIQTSVLRRQILIRADVAWCSLFGGHVPIDQQATTERRALVMCDSMMLSAQPDVVIRLTYCIQDETTTRSGQLVVELCVLPPTGYEHHPVVLASLGLLRDQGLTPVHSASLPSMDQYGQRSGGVEVPEDPSERFRGSVVLLMSRNGCGGGSLDKIVESLERSKARQAFSRDRPHPINAL